MNTGDFPRYFEDIIVIDRAVAVTTAIKLNEQTRWMTAVIIIVRLDRICAVQRHEVRQSAL